MNFTEEELRQLKLSPILGPARSDTDKLLEIRNLLDNYERHHLIPRGLRFSGEVLPRIVSIVFDLPNTLGPGLPSNRL